MGRKDAEAETGEPEEGRAADGAEGKPAHTAALTCELCGGPVIEHHCKLTCLNCGYQRDCSDP